MADDGKVWWRWWDGGGMMRFQKDARHPPLGDYQDSHVLIIFAIVLVASVYVAHSVIAATTSIWYIWIKEGFFVPMSFTHYAGLSAVCANIMAETGCHVSFRKRRQGINLLWYHHWEHRHEPHGVLSLVSQDWDKLQAGVRIAEDFVKDVYFAKTLEGRGLAHPEREQPEEQPEDRPAASSAAERPQVTAWKPVLTEGVIRSWRLSSQTAPSEASGSGPVAQTPPPAPAPAAPAVVAQIQESDTTREQQATSAQEAEEARGDRIARWRALAKGKGYKQQPLMPITSHADVPALVEAFVCCAIAI